jgi:enamine deaminase RidA (YjgF/YER057c/UK114 family)
MTSVSLIRSDSLAASAPYAYASTAPADARLVFLAGACPIDLHGEVTDRGDIAAQARLCVSNLETALAAAGATLNDVLSTRVLVATTQQRELTTAWAVVREAFGEHDAPSTLLGVTVLGYPGQLVEVEAIAAVRD